MILFSKAQTLVVYTGYFHSKMRKLIKQVLFFKIKPCLAIIDLL